MEDKNSPKQKRGTHPKQIGTFLSHFFFCWEIPVLIKGWKKELNEDDLYSPLKAYKSQSLGNALEKAWFEQKGCKNPSLKKALFKIFGFKFVLLGILYLPVDLMILLAQPLLLAKLLDYFAGDKDMTINEAYMYAFLITLSTLSRAIIFNFLLIEMLTLGMTVRIACSSLIYRNILKVRRKEMKITTGQLINLLSNDVTRFDEAFTFVHYLWIAPIELVLSGFYLDANLGHSSLAGIGVILVCLMFQVFISKNVFKARREVAQKTDKRVFLLNDVISGIRVIKMHTLESSFYEMLQAARNLELKKITSANNYRIGLTSFKFYITSLCVFAGVATLTLTGAPITPQYLYFLETIYENLILSFIIFIPVSLIRLLEASVSVQRIQDFLLSVDTPKSWVIERLQYHSQSVNIFQKEPPLIHLRNISTKSNILSNITFSANSTELVGIVGPSGSGKSTLLQVILQEEETHGGTFTTKGTISYASQNPWILNGSIRQNILFGEDFDVEKYHTVVNICALSLDFSVLPQGDATIVGDKKTMLSEGQKARVSLARAVYKDADVYLLDEPLAAVDSRVARVIFDECIVRYLGSKCVVLVTHQVQYLQGADKIYVLDKGRVRDCGRYHKLVALKKKLFPKVATIKESLPVVPLKNYVVVEKTKKHRSSGPSFTPYKRYVKSVGHVITVVVFLLIILSQIVISMIDYFLSLWVTYDSWFLSVVTKDNVFIIYVCLLVSVVLIVTISVFFFIRCSRKASKTLHDTLLTTTIYGTTTFFDNHPSGRILNRFTKDMGDIDEILPMSLFNTLTGSLTIIGILFLVCLSNYWMLLISFLLVVIVYFCYVVFQVTNKSLKRTEGMTKSLVFSHVNATVHGLMTIRASAAQKILTEEFDDHQDLHTSAFYLLTAVFCSLGFWADVLSALYTGFVTFGFLLIPTDFQIGSVGMAITQATSLVSLFEYLVKVWGEVDTHMTSVDRVLEYCDLPPEADTGNLTVSWWPTAGTITFDSVSLKYTPEQYVLKSVSFHVCAGEKIGIVGRTGAGKSSLISTLFRLFDFEGHVIIDGVNTKVLPLATLRSKISIIPQNPVLFVGTLRRNIDPFGKASDAEIWRVLQELDLNKIVSALTAGLDTQVFEDGSNFSVGQKQIFCLVRAVLRKNRIIVLHEATANVDLVTDELIQNTIKTKFDGCTLLTVAHRLNTVAGSDRIIVMDDGKVVEFERPEVLLRNKKSVFYEFVKESGDKTLEEANIKVARS